MNNNQVLAFLPVWILAVFAILCLSMSGPAYAAKCGGNNQRPCKVFERIPSCNKGLVENFKTKKCIAPKKKATPKPKAKPSCGAQNQRPCLITERVPSCNKGLVENFQQKKCLAPKKIICGALNQRPCLVTERVPSCNNGLVENFQQKKCLKPRKIVCGALNQRPCLVTERVPSCNPGLAENFRTKRCVKPAPIKIIPKKRVSPPTSPRQCGGFNQRPCLVTERIPACDRGLRILGNKCRAYPCGADKQRACKITERLTACNKGLMQVRGTCYKANCGAVGQRPCMVYERIPSCDEGLVEYANGKCLRLDCGALNQKACKITQRVPSCDKGLRETADGFCVVLQPGEIPFLATIGDWSTALANVTEGTCIKGLEAMQSAPIGIGGFPSLQPAQVKYFRVGFTCAIASKINQLSGTTAMIQEANRQMKEYPCASVTPLLRPVCALYKTQTTTFGAAATCGIGLAKQGMIRGKGGSLRETWLGMGKFAWVVADALNLGKNKGKGGKKPKKGSKEAADAKRDTMNSALSSYGLTINYTAKAQRFLNGPQCERVN